MTMKSNMIQANLLKLATCIGEAIENMFFKLFYIFECSTLVGQRPMKSLSSVCPPVRH